MTQPTQSIHWQISRAMLAALQASADLAHLTWLDNPVHPAEIAEAGARVAWLEDGDDVANTLDKAAQQDIRVFSLRLGVAAMPTAAQLAQHAASPAALRLQLRQQVDADIVAVKAVLLVAWQRWVQAATTGRRPLISSGGSLREGTRSGRIEGVSGDAAALMTSIDCQYQEAARSLRG
jgi:hypothetical protein